DVRRREHGVLRLSERRASRPSALMGGTEASGPVPCGCACVYQHRRITVALVGKRACVASAAPWGRRLRPAIAPAVVGTSGHLHGANGAGHGAPLWVGGGIASLSYGTA